VALPRCHFFDAGLHFGQRLDNFGLSSRAQVFRYSLTRQESCGFTWASPGPSSPTLVESRFPDHPGRLIARAAE
jgi:hypothetical protein